MAGPPQGRWVFVAIAAAAALVAALAFQGSPFAVDPSDSVRPGAEESSEPQAPAARAVGTGPRGARRDGAPRPGAVARAPCTIRLRVLRRGDRVPLEHARVGAVGEGVAPAASDSDPQGSVVLSGLDSGVDYDLRVERAPYGAVRILGVRLAPGEARDLGAVALGAGYLVRGSVLDPTGQGLSGARVALVEPQAPAACLAVEDRLLATVATLPTPIAVATTGLDGSFEIEGLRAGRYDLVASAAGRAASRLPTLRLSEAHPVASVRVVLADGGRIRGRVTAGAGEPHREMRVLALPVATPGAGRTEARTSDGSAVEDDGRYVLEGLEIGRGHRLAVVASGRATYVAPDVVLVTERDAEVDLVLPATGRLEGIVRRRGEDSPIEGATVHVFVQRPDRAPIRIPEGRLPAAVAAAVTGPDGRFAIPGLPEGRVAGRVRAPGCLPSSASTSGATAWGDVHAGQTLSVELELARGASVLGLVRLGRGGPWVEGADVLLLDTNADPATGPADGVPRAASDGEGRFRIDGVAPGSYEVLARASEASLPLERGAAPRVEVPEGATEVQVQLVLEPTTRLRGTVLGTDDTPVAGATVSLLRASRGASERGAPRLLEDALPLPTDRTDERGGFLLDGLPPDASWLVEVRAVGFVPATSALVDPAAAEGGSVEIRMHPAARVAGRVTDETGAPLPGATVVARWSVEGADPWAADGTWPHPDAGTQSARTGTDGRFALTGFASGQVELWATHPDRASAEGGRRSLAEGKALDDVVLVLQRGHSIVGRVVDVEDRPVAGVLVAGLDPEPGPGEGSAGAHVARAARLGRTARTDARGRFELAHLADRPHTLAILRGPGLGDAPRSSLAGVRPGEAEVRIRLDVDVAPRR